MAEDDRPAAPDTGVATSDDSAAAQFNKMLRGSLLPTAAVGAACVVVALFFGVKPAWSAALGAALVLVFFSLSLLVMRETAHLAPNTVMAIVLAVYTGKIVLLAVALLLLHDASWLSGRALGLTVVVCTVVWLAFEMRAFTRLRILVGGAADGRS